MPFLGSKACERDRKEAGWPKGEGTLRWPANGDAARPTGGCGATMVLRNRSEFELKASRIDPWLNRSHPRKKHDFEKGNSVELRQFLDGS